MGKGTGSTWNSCSVCITLSTPGFRPRPCDLGQNMPRLGLTCTEILLFRLKSVTTDNYKNQHGQFEPLVRKEDSADRRAA